MIDLHSFSFGATAGVVLTVILAVIANVATTPEPIITHTTDAELTACMVAMDRSADALDEIEAWLHEMQGVWVISVPDTEVPE